MKKPVRILVAMLLFFSLIITPVSPVTATDNDSFNVSGYTMSESYFKAAYGSDPAQRDENLTRLGGETKTSRRVRISDVDVQSGIISLAINMGTTEKNILITGRLCASAKTQNGVNCIVVEAKCSSSAYDVLFFEIWNDDDIDHQLLYAKAIANEPHVKIYLQNISGDISIFEFSLPTALSNLNATDYDKAHKYIDLLWGLKVMDAKVSEVDATEENIRMLGLTSITREAGAWETWVNNRVYVNTFYIYETRYTSTSLPSVVYRYNNATSDEATWVASFKLSECLTVTDPYSERETYYGNNAFDYRDIKLVFGCGDNTTFIRSYQEGRMRDSGNIWGYLQNVTVYFLTKTVSLHPVGAVAVEIIEMIETLTPSAAQQVTLGSPNVQLYNGHTIISGQNLAERYWLEACTDQGNQANVGDYYTFQTIVQYENAGGSENTIGVLTFKFDVYEGGEEYKMDRSDEIVFSYVASAD